MSKQSDHVVSVFSGAGGFSHGFSSVGLKPAFGAELSEAACRTYEDNVASPCHRLDLSVASPDFFTRLLGGARPFALIGGPPCQGFSTAGPRNAGDPRNRLVLNYLRIVEALKPRWFVFENVEGLLTCGEGRDVTALVGEFLRIGYSVRLEKVNLAGYGVPQTRKRVLIVGNRMGADFRFPAERFSYDSGKAKKSNGRPFAPSLMQAIAGLGAPARTREQAVAYAAAQPSNDYDASMRSGNVGGTVSDHVDATLAADADRYRLLAAGQSMKDLPEALWHASFKRRAFRRVMDGTPTERRGGAPSGLKRLHGDLQSLTITGASARELIHPQADRPLTRRECARIQTFPDRYRFHGGAADVARQIGNAVPPLAAAEFARHLRALDGAFGSDLQPLATAAAPRLLGYVLTDSSARSDALKKTAALLDESMRSGRPRA
ncbi:DNA cytosine methyltransferase [Lysobacter capsici]|uniref:DNA cytosine methyltransferase n=1 Tax=Lysobacter capsici TaxID=435897 RepID=UPI001C007759|nr:DNA cytosine methyltransferase [Lysobacter capsici]QWF18550.1 DNA cytosine methyltransferase [Lysobacter capsici]